MSEIKCFDTQDLQLLREERKKVSENVQHLHNRYDEEKALFRKHVRELNEENAQLRTKYRELEAVLESSKTAIVGLRTSNTQATEDKASMQTQNRKLKAQVQQLGQCCLSAKISHSLPQVSVRSLA